MKELNVYSFFDECYVYYGDYKKEVERLKEEIESWKRVATKNFNEAEDCKSIIKEVRERLLNENKPLPSASEIIDILDKENE